jgi:hypothetical protein
MRDLRWAGCVLTAAVLWAMPPEAGAADLNRDLLKQGMTLPEAIKAFGQPVRVEWVNLKGTAIFFLFYESADCLLCLETIKGTGVLTQADGRTVLPLGFATEKLAGWGKDFYEQNRSPQISPGPNAP